MIELFDRHKGLFGEEAFACIRRSRVLVAGAGGLGSTVLQLLVRGGFGTIYIYDYAVVDLPDLNRQLLYNLSHVGVPKVEAACSVLLGINPDASIIPRQEKISRESVLPEVDFVIDCLDTFEDRFSLDEVVFKRGVPLIHGGVSGFFGQVTTLIPGKTQGFQELFGNERPPEDRDIPRQVFPPAVTAVASILASEAFKLASGRTQELLAGTMLTLDFHSNSFEIIRLGNAKVTDP